MEDVTHSAQRKIMNDLQHVAFESDPQLVHRILLTDSSEFDKLQPRRPSVSFAGFSENLRSGGAPEYVMKRAHRDHVCDRVETSGSLEPIKDLLQELHATIRALVPNRTDLHSILNDDHHHFETKQALLLAIKAAAEALSKLESEERAEHTKALLLQMNDEQSSTSFLVEVVFYLIDKAQLCDQDKQDFYLSHVVAPKLHGLEGKALERKAFHKRFGDVLPLTSQWVEDLVDDAQNEDSLRSSSQARKNMIVIGWIDRILFRQDRETVMPEIFCWDVETVQRIRATTRTATAGCAIGLHACQAAQCNPEVLMSKESEGAGLVRALQNRAHPSVTAYEQSIEDAAVALARQWKGADLQPSQSWRLMKIPLCSFRREANHCQIQGQIHPLSNLPRRSFDQKDLPFMPWTLPRPLNWPKRLEFWHTSFTLKIFWIE